MAGNGSGSTLINRFGSNTQTINSRSLQNFSARVAASTQPMSMLQVFDKDRDSPHFLFALFLRLKQFASDYDDMYKLIKDIGDKGKLSDKGATIGSTIIEIKLSTLIGLKEPTSQTGQVGIFLSTYFSGMDAKARKQYFSNNYPGDFNALQQFIDSLPQGSKEDDAVRVRIYNNPRSGISFLKIVIQDKQTKLQERDVYHISVPDNRKVDISTFVRYKPTKVFKHQPPITETIHLTKEDPLDIKKNIQYDFKFDTLEPVTEAAENLVIDATTQPPSVTPLGLLLGLKIPSTVPTSARIGYSGPTGRPQSSLGKKPGGKRTYRKKQKRISTRRLRHF